VSIDVGANIGFYSALLSPLSRRVISFEANPKLLLYISLITHRFDNISIFPVAVGSGSGEIKFNIPFGSDGDILSHSGSGASSPLFLSKMGIEFREAMVPIVAIDNFKFDNIGFLKIDVEGAEYDVLMGAFETINKNRPNIVLENEFRHNKNCSNIFDFMERCKYNGYFYDRLAKKIKSLSLFSLQENQIDLLDMNGDISDPNRYVYNFIFIPSEHDQLLNLVDQEEAL
jgi:FkbM family methyltransferase